MSLASVPLDYKIKKQQNQVSCVCLSLLEILFYHAFDIFFKTITLLTYKMYNKYKKHITYQL